MGGKNKVKINWDCKPEKCKLDFFKFVACLTKKKIQLDIIRL